MKNITAFAGLVIMLICARPVFSQNAAQKYAFSVSPQFGFMYGQAEEIVYPPPSLAADFLSQLLWDIKPVAYYGMEFDLSQAQPLAQWGFFTTVGFKAGIPGSSGIMEDRDWMSAENSALTHFSTHDNTTKKLFTLNVSTGFSFPLNRMMLLKTYVGISYMNMSFSGENGHGKYAREDPPLSGKYASINDNPVLWPFTGPVINYTQNWFHAAPGVSLQVYFLERFVTAVSLQVTPLVWCADEDQHLTTNAQFNDYMRGGLFIEPALELSFIINKTFEVSLDCSWRYISGTRGETYISVIGSENYIQNGEAGAALSVLDAVLGVKMRL